MVAHGMRRLAATTLALVLATAATAGAAPARVDRLEHADGVAFGLRALPRLTAEGEGRFAFTAVPPAGDDGPYSVDGTIDAPPVGLAGRHVLLIGTAIACGPPAATAVYGTVHSRGRRVVATTSAGESYRLRRVRAPRRWGFGGRVVGRIITGRASIARVEAFSRSGRRLAVARFADPPACPAR
jgi:hypothetical protein